MTLHLTLTLRPFQQAAIAALRAAHAAGQRRMHVVAPPGAGKTILGLAWVAELGERAVVLSPTSTIAAQWVDKANTFLIDPIADPALAALDGSDLVASTEPYADAPPPLLSLTYQAVSVRARGEDALHDNVYALFERLDALGVRLVLLDECHHLLDHWANALLEWRARAEARGAPIEVVGLTATPPVDAAREQAGRYLEVVGDVTYLIPLPALIRDGVLAPYQDLAWLVEPTQREVAHIAAAHERFGTLTERLHAPGDALLSLAFWIQHRLEQEAEPGDPDAELSGWAEFLVKKPDLAIAFVRIGRTRNVGLPVLAWELDEMTEPPELDDYRLALADYATGYLLPLRDAAEHPLGLGTVAPDEQAAAAALWDEIRASLRPLGATLTRRGIQQRASSLDRLLGLSAAKFAALHDILHIESRALHDDLRAVVVVDFEKATRGRSVEELEGVLDPDAGGAVAVLRSLASHPEHGALEPIMITGSNLICDADVADHVAVALNAAAAQHGWRITVEQEPAGALTRIVGRGPDWRSSRYTLLVTELFERGVTRCIVGTRGLLGEGWDVRSANVLVDLTSVASFVATNQLRGRCIRLDPDRPDKVANLWDVVAIAPAMARGFADWHRFVRKHGHVYGVADDGAIELGVGHVHPRFTHVPAAELAGFMGPIRDDMAARAADRATTRNAWRIGTPYRNETIESVELRKMVEREVWRDAPLPAGIAQARARSYGASQRRATEDEQRALTERERVYAEAAKHDAEADAVVASSRSNAESGLVLVGARVDRAQRRVDGLPARAFASAALGVAGVFVLGAAWPLGLAAMVMGGDAWSAWANRRRTASWQATQELAAKEVVLAGRKVAEIMQSMARDLRTEADAAYRHGVTEAAAIRARADQALLKLLLPSEAAALYGEVLLAAFCEWEETRARAEGARVHSGARVDGTLHVELLDADSELTSMFAQAFRACTGPVGDPRYLLVCGPATISGALDEALAARDATMAAHDAVANGHAVLAIPPPFGDRRSGADAFARAWRARIGPCEALYTRRGEGAALRGRVAQQQGWGVRAATRQVWR